MEARLKHRSVLVAPLLHVALVLYVLVLHLDTTVYDDSYFFARFARNALHHGVFAWNVEDGPVHGSTSQLFQLVTTAIFAVTDTHFVVATKLVNAGVLVGAGVLLLVWAGRRTEDPREGALVALVAFDTPLVLTTVQTGMETAMTLLVLVATFVVLTPGSRPGGLGRPPPGELPPGVPAAILTALVYLARPDAAALPFVYVCTVGLGLRRLPIAYLTTLAALLGALWLAFHAYYGTPLPLSFYMKTGVLGHYGADITESSLPVKRVHVLGALVFAAPFLWIGTVGVRASVGDRRITIVALLAASVAFFGYHLFLTTEIMGYRGRFYLPAFAPLALAGVLSWDAFVARGSLPTRALFCGIWLGITALGYACNWIPNGRGFFISAIEWPAYVGWGAALSALLLFAGVAHGAVRLLPVALGAIAGVVGWYPPRWPSIPSDREILRRQAAEVTTVRGIFDVERCLPDVKVVYHSEMGVPALVLPDTRLVDFAGILSRETGIERRPLKELCERDRPEAIFLPHRAYRELNEELRESGCLEAYRRVVDKSASPLHVRRDLYADFMKCARDVHRWRKK